MVVVQVTFQVICFSFGSTCSGVGDYGGYWCSIIFSLLTVYTIMKIMISARLEFRCLCLHSHNVTLFLSVLFLPFAALHFIHFHPTLYSIGQFCWLFVLYCFFALSICKHIRFHFGNRATNALSVIDTFSYIQPLLLYPFEPNGVIV